MIIQVADAITAELNGHSFSQEFEATRVYGDVDVELSEEGLRVDVMPVAKVPSELLTRGYVVYHCSTDIVLRKKLPTYTYDDVDGFVQLVQEVHEWLMFRELNYEATWESTDLVVAVNHTHLREWKQFTGIITVTYSVTKCLEHPAESNLISTSS